MTDAEYEQIKKALNKLGYHYKFCELDGDGSYTAFSKVDMAADTMDWIKIYTKMD